MMPSPALPLSLAGVMSGTLPGRSVKVTLQLYWPLQRRSVAGMYAVRTTATVPHTLTPPLSTSSSSAFTSAAVALHDRGLIVVNGAGVAMRLCGYSMLADHSEPIATMLPGVVSATSQW
eukprot:2771-Heterococcus_DN1.PRE.1